MDIRSTIDAVGDGVMVVTLRMNAKDWAGWKRQYGANPSLFKRDISKMFTQYELTDFDLEQDDMDRQAIVRIRAKAISTYEGNGLYQVELGKGMTKGDLVNGEYRVTYTEPQGANTISLIDQRVMLPEGSHDAKVATGGSGTPVLRYRLEPATGGMPWLWISAALLVVGAGLLAGSLRTTKPKLQAVTQVMQPGSMAS